jgi:hypothetical protein
MKLKITENQYSRLISEAKKNKYYVAQNADTMKFDVMNKSTYNIAKSFHDKETADRYAEHLNNK